MKRIVIIANKFWEAEPILSAMLNTKITPLCVSAPQRPDDKNPNYSDQTLKLNYPWNNKFSTIDSTKDGDGSDALKPMVEWTYQGGNVVVELWCLAYVLDSRKNILPANQKGGTPPDFTDITSSSDWKNRCLPSIFQYGNNPPDFTIAIGTAGYPPKDNDESHNGCVIIGSNIFIHDFYPEGKTPNPRSNFKNEKFEQLLSSTIPDQFFVDVCVQDVLKTINCSLLMPFLTPPNAPDINSSPQVLFGKEYLGVSVVNVTDYREYSDDNGVGADKDGIDAAKTALTQEITTIGSLETTHGIIRLNNDDAPFIFISGITDRSTMYFKEDDSLGMDKNGSVKTLAQNFTAAFNAGVCIGNLLPKIVDYVTAQK